MLPQSNHPGLWKLLCKKTRIIWPKIELLLYWTAWRCHYGRFILKLCTRCAGFCRTYISSGPASAKSDPFVLHFTWFLAFFLGMELSQAWKGPASRQFQTFIILSLNVMAWGIGKGGKENGGGVRGVQRDFIFHCLKPVWRVLETFKSGEVMKYQWFDLLLISFSVWKNFKITRFFIWAFIIFCLELLHPSKIVKFFIEMIYYKMTHWMCLSSTWWADDQYLLAARERPVEIHRKRLKRPWKIDRKQLLPGGGGGEGNRAARRPIGARQIAPFPIRLFDLDWNLPFRNSRLDLRSFCGFYVIFSRLADFVTEFVSLRLIVPENSFNKSCKSKTERRTCLYKVSTFVPSGKTSLSLTF